VEPKLTSTVLAARLKRSTSASIVALKFVATATRTSSAAAGMLAERGDAEDAEP
jgi:hypothetical protein